MSFVLEAEELLKNSKITNIEAMLVDLKTQLDNINDYSSPDYISIIKKISIYENYTKKINDLRNELKSYNEAIVIKDEPELADIAQQQISDSELKIEKLLSELIFLVQVSLPNDDKKAIFEIRPGVGGIEASIFAEDLFKMYIRYCNTLKLTSELFSLTYNSEGGISEAIFLIDEEGSYGKFRFEGGVHRVQRVPKTEALGRIHTSTASVVVMPKFEEKSIEINLNEIRIDVYRSSGPGGQSVNTTDSAVRITHIPTGIIVTCQNGKSQHKNKEMAMSVLYSKLQSIEDEKRNSEEMQLRKDNVETSDRSSKIRTYNFPQSRITDHRVNESWFNIEEVMNGFLEEILIATNKELRK